MLKCDQLEKWSPFILTKNLGDMRVEMTCFGARIGAKMGISKMGEQYKYQKIFARRSGHFQLSG